MMELLLALTVSWQAVRAGVWQADFQPAKSGVLSAVRVIAVRVDPAKVRFTLRTATRDYGLRPAWTIDSIPPEGIIAVNAGQFRGPASWGWLVKDGVEMQPPGSGSLAMAFVVDSAGQASLVTPEEFPGARGRAYNGFQSYPALLIDGEIPWELQADGRGVDLGHRDSRLALCTRRDGSVVIALTRFGVFGKKGDTLPLGPTVPEMARLMKSLGCQRAMLLDGGISSQLVVRDAKGAVRRWSNWRAVPLGLVVIPR